MEPSGIQFPEGLIPSSSSTSIRARVNKSSLGPASPFGIVHTPSSFLAKNGPPGCASRTWIILLRRIFHAIFQRQTRRSCKSANNAERAECCRINAGSDRQKMISLVTRDGGAGERTHSAVGGIGVVTELLQLSLNTGHDLVRRKPVVAINRFVVPIIRGRIVTPGRIPPAVIPTPPAPIEKDDGGAAVSSL